MPTPLVPTKFFVKIIRDLIGSCGMFLCLIEISPPGRAISPPLLPQEFVALRGTRVTLDSPSPLWFPSWSRRQSEIETYIPINIRMLQWINVTLLSFGGSLFLCLLYWHQICPPDAMFPAPSHILWREEDAFQLLDGRFCTWSFELVYVQGSHRRIVSIPYIHDIYI